MSQTSPPGLSDDLRQLRRSRSDRVVAGVAGGLGARLGLDPLVLRIITVVLAIFGGVGIVLYALGWLLIPDEDAERSVAEQALSRKDDSAMDTSAVALAVGLIIAILIAGGSTFGSGVGPLLLALAVIGVVAILRRRDDDDDADPVAVDGQGDWPGAGWSSTDSTDTVSSGTGWSAPEAGSSGVDTDSPTTSPEPAHPAAASAAGDVVVPVADASTEAPAGTGWPEGPDWGPPEPVYVPEPPAPTPPPRSYLGVLTISAVVVALGVLAINDATWASIPPSGYIATALAVVGIGLLVGTWFGRSRGLIGLGVLLALALPPAVIVGDDPNFNADRTTVIITSMAEMPSEPVSYGTGQVTYDLSGLELADTDEFVLEISQRIGQLQVIVPPEADVDVTAVSSLGEVRTFDGLSGGIHAERSTVDLGPDGAGGGSIILDLSLSVGQIEVTR